MTVKTFVSISLYFVLQRKRWRKPLQVDMNTEKRFSFKEDPRSFKYRNGIRSFYIKGPCCLTACDEDEDGEEKDCQLWCSPKGQTRHSNLKDDPEWKKLIGKIKSVKCNC